MMRRAILLLFMASLAASAAVAQHGYLGKRGLLSFGVNDRLWSNAWSVSYFRTIGAQSALRMDIRVLSADRDLREGRNGLIDPGRTIGTLEGAGFGLGAHYYVHSDAGLSAPLGYFAGFGIEYSGGRTTEHFSTPYRIYAETSGPDILVEGNVEYRHRVLRLIYTWGVRKVISGNVVLDLGAELSIVLRDRVTTDDDGPAPTYAFPFEPCAVDSDFKKKKEGEFGRGTLTLQPVLRVGYLF